MLCVTYNYAQIYSISGFVKDSSSGDLLPNAHIVNKSDGEWVIANSYGFFVLKTTSNSVELKVSFAGYNALEKMIEINSDTVITCKLTSDNRIQEIVVKESKKTVKNEVGHARLSGKEIEQIPSMLGEKDLLKALQLLPGIKMGREGSSGLYVRGGTPGQNLILLDDVPVYNVNHLFGFFSVFTPEAIKTVDVYKGAFPARYGGRIASVLDVRMREGNLYKTKADITIGNLSSKIVFETPLIMEKASLLVSARRTYLDIFLYPLTSNKSYDGKTSDKSAYNFHDLNMKLFWDINNWGKIYWSNYTGRDIMSFVTKSDFTDNITDIGIQGKKQASYSKYHWGNYTSSLRWNKVFSDKLFMNTTLIFSRYTYVFDLEDNVHFYKEIESEEKTTYNNTSGITDWGAKIDFDYFISNNSHLSFGINGVQHAYIPGKVLLKYTHSDGDKFEAHSGSKVDAYELNSYVENKILLFNKLQLFAGVHYSIFKTNDTSFNSFQPRIRLLLNYGEWVFKSSGGYMVQPAHNLVNRSTSLAVDIWVPSHKNINPSSSVQFDLGFSHSISNNLEISLEGYWRAMNNIITYKKGESFIRIHENWSDKIISGKGASYGAELMLRKPTGKTTGWLGYTWSVSNQQFDELNHGEPFPSDFDRRHYFTVALNHKVSKRIDLSGNWVFASGEPISFSTTAYDGDTFYGQSPQEVSYLGVFDKHIHAPDQIIYYRSVNQYRLPAYHRLDLGIDFIKDKKNGTRTWSISLYNAYAQNNPFMLSVEMDEESRKLELVNSTPFRFLPSLSYRFVFN